MAQPRAPQKKILEFLITSGQLKAELRRGWIRKVGIKRPESVADHSYRTALMTMLFADLKGIDTSRALRMAILHDLPEAVIGDAIPDETPLRERRKQETTAIMELLSKIPPSLRSNYRGVWNELMAKRSKEARLVWELDKLEMAIQAHEYAWRRYGKLVFREFFETARKSIRDPLLRQVLALL